MTVGSMSIGRKVLFGVLAVILAVGIIAAYVVLLVIGPPGRA